MMGRGTPKCVRRDRPLWLPAVLGSAVTVLVFVVAAILNWWSTLDWGPL